jgi:hypothetical protein
MDHRVELSDDGLMLIVIAEGNANVHGVIIAINGIVDHPEWKKGNNILVDCRKLTTNDLSQSKLQFISDHFRSVEKNLRWKARTINGERDRFWESKIMGDHDRTCR